MQQVDLLLYMQFALPEHRQPGFCTNMKKSRTKIYSTTKSPPQKNPRTAAALLLSKKIVPVRGASRHNGEGRERREQQVLEHGDAAARQKGRPKGGQHHLGGPH